MSNAHAFIATPFSTLDSSDEFFAPVAADYPEFHEWFARKAAAGAEARVLRSTEGRLIAWYYVKVEAANTAKLGSMLVAPEYRGCGLARQAMQSAIEQALDLDTIELFATIPFDDDRRSFLEHFGFSAVEGEDPLLLYRPIP